jgi:methionyl-tRNA formyltransferase
MRIIYLGTPEFAVPTLEKLFTWEHGEVVALVTQPDRPAGRGRHIFPPPTKVVATSHGIPIFQPEKLSRSPEIVQAMRQLNPDVLVMVAFGQILKKEVLTMAPMGVINLHGSLLPKYRGAAPINWAVINGESETGNTSMFSDSGVDTGEMLLKQVVPIGADTTAEELAQTMSEVGADLIIQTLDQLRNGTLRSTKQDDSQATLAPRMTKDMGQLNAEHGWKKPAKELHNLVRGLTPWPGTSTTLHGLPVKIISTRTCTNESTAKAPDNAPSGTLVLDSKRVFVSCGSAGTELIELIEVQPPNKARMKASDWVNGSHLADGTQLGT